MTYERESLIEKHLVAEVKKAGGTAYKFVSPGRRSVPDRLGLPPGGQSSLSAKPPAGSHGPNSCVNMTDSGRWVLMRWCLPEKNARASEPQ